MYRLIKDAARPVITQPAGTKWGQGATLVKASCSSVGDYMHICKAKISGNMKHYLPFTVVDPPVIIRDVIGFSKYYLLDSWRHDSFQPRIFVHIPSDKPNMFIYMYHDIHNFLHKSSFLCSDYEDLKIREPKGFIDSFSSLLPSVPGWGREGGFNPSRTPPGATIPRLRWELSSLRSSPGTAVPGLGWD